MPFYGLSGEQNVLSVAFGLRVNVRLNVTLMVKVRLKVILTNRHKMLTVVYGGVTDTSHMRHIDLRCDSKRVSNFVPNDQLFYIETDINCTEIPDSYAQPVITLFTSLG